MAGGRRLKPLSGRRSRAAARKKSAGSLRHCAQELSGVLEHAPVGILFVDADFRVARVNPIAQRILGEIPRLAGRDFDEVLHRLWPKEHADEVAHLFRFALETGTPYQTAECVHHRRDRDVTESYEWSIQRTRLRDGRFGVVCYIRDIASERQTQQALSLVSERHEQQARLFEGVLSTTPDFVYVFDLQGRFLYANRRLLEVWGMKLPEVVGKTCRQLGYEQWHHDLHMREIAQVIRTKRQIKGEVPFKAPLTGIFGIYEYIFTPVFGPGGEVEFIAGTTRDVTDRKKVEAALRRSEERLAQAVRVAKVGTFDHDHVGDKVEVLPALREILGFAPDEAVTLAGILGRVVPEDRERVAEAIRTSHNPAGNGTFQVEHRIRVGEAIRWVSVRAQTSFAGEGRQLRAVRTIGAVLDITEQKEEEIRLERLVAERTARLQDTVGELEHFSYTITHDMRAPLRAMQGFAGLMLNDCAGLRPDQQEYMRRIAGSAERMDELITDALNYSKVVREELELEPVDPGALLRGISESYPQFQSPVAMVEINGHFPLVLANKAGLTQCFSNLLSNAVKFVAPGVVPWVRVWAEEGPAGAVAGATKSPAAARMVRIWFEDNGIGIAPEHHEVIFAMFQRLSQTYEGTGIGLALVRKVVERMRGHVGVESEQGQGSRFWVELPSYNKEPEQRVPEALKC